MHASSARNSPGLSTTVGDQRENELLETSEWWGLMIRRGSKTFRHSDDKRSALKIVDYLIGLRRRAVLEIQMQLIDEQRSLQDTSAGMEVERELQQAKFKFAEDIKELKAEQRQAQLEGDIEVANILRKEFEKREEDRLKKEKDLQDLRITFQQLLARSKAKNDRLMQQLQQQMQQKEQDYRNVERRFDDERKANEDRHRQRDEEVARERRRNEDAQRQRDESFAAERERYEAHIQRRDAGMASQKQQLESTISSLQERVSDLASRIFSNHSLPLHSSTLSPSEGPPRVWI